MVVLKEEKEINGFPIIKKMYSIRFQQSKNIRLQQSDIIRRISF